MTPADYDGADDYITLSVTSAIQTPLEPFLLDT